MNTDNQDNEETGAAFQKHQQATDQAKNEKIKSEKGTDDLAPEDANRKQDRNMKTDVSVKKTGGGKQSSPGD